MRIASVGARIWGTGLSTTSTSKGPLKTTALMVSGNTEPMIAIRIVRLEYDKATGLKQYKKMRMIYKYFKHPSPYDDFIIIRGLNIDI